jgi:uncharacterized repeat protein (TIGR03803 family)
MRCKRFSIAFTRPMAMLTAVVALMLASSAFASSSAHEKVIYSFQDSNNVADEGPQSRLIVDAAGNFYGTDAGNSCCGIVFELSPPATSGGAWTETLLYSFKGGPDDGDGPAGALVFDKLGNLYGTTLGGGSGPCQDFGGGCGVIFKLAPPASQEGAWTETVLHSFQGGESDGEAPEAALIFDPYGNLYGTTSKGGSSACGVLCGTVFELSPPAISGGAWREQVLHSFGVQPNDGVVPMGDLIFDRAGALYGTASTGGVFGLGTAFQLVRRNGSWTENTIYSFNNSQGHEGAYPVAGLTFDGAGDLYGTLSGDHDGAVCDCGEVFELTPPAAAGDSWTETTLYLFTGGKDGATPMGNVIFDKSGNLYSTTKAAGLKQNRNIFGNGSVFELRPPTIPGGAWTETTLHDFTGDATGDGGNSYAGLVFFKGKLYGTTKAGGLNQAGTVFSVTIDP